MDTRQITYRGAGVHRVKPPVRWAWVIALSLAVIGATFEWATRHDETGQSPTATEVTSAHPDAPCTDKRT